MCLIIKDGEVERTATEDRVVYKIIRNDNKSLYQHFQYEPNTLYSIDKLKINYYGEIHEGFHSYLKYRIALEWAYVASYYDGASKLVEFTIPKGAKYYIGIFGEIVSTAIRSGDLENCQET